MADIVGGLAGSSQPPVIVRVREPERLTACILIRAVLRYSGIRSYFPNTQTSSKRHEDKSTRADHD
jgi:hypothetical protein